LVEAALEANGLFGPFDELDLIWLSDVAWPVAQVRSAMSPTVGRGERRSRSAGVTG